MFQVIDKTTNQGVKVYGVKIFDDETYFLVYCFLYGAGCWAWSNAKGYKPLDCDIK